MLGQTTAVLLTSSSSASHARWAKGQAPGSGSRSQKVMGAAAVIVRSGGLARAGPATQVHINTDVLWEAATHRHPPLFSRTDSLKAEETQGKGLRGSHLGGKVASG